MNEADRQELDRLKQHQAQLENELKRLGHDIRLLELQVTQSYSTPAAVKSPEPARRPEPSSPPIPKSPVAAQSIPGEVPPIISSLKPLESAKEPARQAGSAFVRQDQQNPGASQTTKPVGIPSYAEPRVIPAASATLQPPVPRHDAGTARSLEMRLGTFWLVRIGVVMVLTALVFFGNLAYQNYISRLGPGGKVLLLYLSSGCLLAGGWWWQRQTSKEALRNYAQVLFAGGLAATYFTTYAAHHLPRLRIIESPLLDGLLLLICAGFMVWAAERKKSEILALFAVGLAYYTSIITHVGSFTLWSNLVLSATAVLFLLRNRWATLSFASLAATYAAYAFWRFFDGSAWHWASPAEGLWSGVCFLILYWVVFTSAVFVSRSQAFSGQTRASFLTVNNGAFFTLFLLTMLQVQHGGFWKFSLIYGAALLGLSILAELVLNEEALVANTYLTQGLVLVTLGFISKFAGMELALILAAQSVLLLVFGQLRKNLVLKTGAYIAAALAVAWGMDGLQPFDVPGRWLGSGVGLLILANAVITHRRLSTAEPSSRGQMPVLRPQPSYFVVLALTIWTITTWKNTSTEWFPLALALETLVLTFSVYALGVRELTLLSQALLLLGQGCWVVQWFQSGAELPWWNPVLLIVASLVLSHWWQGQRRVQLAEAVLRSWLVVYALVLDLVLYIWLAQRFSPPLWLVITAALTVALTAYGTLTRAWFLAVCGQLFLGISILQFAVQLLNGAPAWEYPLAPIVALGLLSFGAVQWFKSHPATDERVSHPVLELALVYRWLALVLSIAWICEYVPERERVWVTALLGTAVFAWAGWRRNQEALLFSAAFTATALVSFWLPFLDESRVYVPDLAAILLLLAQDQFARKQPERYPIEQNVHRAVVVIGALSLWLFVSRWVLGISGGFYLTASWSILALTLFFAGLLLQERMYRWTGLAILACALGRVVVFDIWRLETIYRILSLMALGIVLLVLGFIYSKYQDKIKEWL